MLLLDTCVCIDYFRKDQSSTSDFSGKINLAEARTSTIVLSELLAVANKSARPERQTAIIDRFIETVHVIPFDDNAARHYGDIRAELEKSGVSIGPLDLLIAAHARSLGATLITSNAKEFRRVKGLKLLAWK